MAQRILIVGGVAGGASAAAKARRVDETAEIDVFERGPYVSFANCGLPYYIGGTVAERGSLLLQTPDSFWKRFRVRVQVRHEVLSVDAAAKTIRVRRLDSLDVIERAYDKLILAPGAGAIVPALPGIDAENIFTVKTVPDSDAIKRYIDRNDLRRAAVIGAGFIGLESVEALKGLGLEVSLVEMLPQVLPPFDADMARFVSDHLVGQGVDVILNDGIKAFHGDPRATAIELASGRTIPTDMVILSIGVRPELQLAKDAGLTIGPSGGIAVDEHQRTSNPDIFAAGDAVEVTQWVTRKKARIALAGPANKQGRVAGANAAGEPLTFAGALGTAIVETLGITAAKTGLSEKEARAAGLDYYASYTHSTDHAGYFPGSSLMHLKLIVENGTGRLLGAEIVGERGVDKRIDVLATAMMVGLRVQDLEQLDLAYAPQFSSAKDPVVMAGFVAANVGRHDVEAITGERLRERLAREDDLQVVDVRTAAEHAAGALPRSRLIPIDELRERIGELDPRRETVVYCRVGLRGYLAARILMQHGFARVLNVTGGLLSCAAAPAAASAAGGGTASPRDFRAIVDDAPARVIDVREPDEFAHERIRGTKNIPLGLLPQGAAMFPKENDLYLLCQSGVRSAEAAARLRAAGYAKLHELAGGLNAWKSAGYPVERSGPIPIMRQVQIVAGVLALMGGVIPGWRWLAAFVGAGLIFAGASGICTMANLLSRMPWNTARSSSGGGEDRDGRHDLIQ